ncbi:MAG TPA: hypothetical protein VN882_10870 [Steroidobacteraceae bacterium]|jgi:hypothetical protein|nr:hypothetical protein [Steroidobacteraceae bacterium]
MAGQEAQQVDEVAGFTDDAPTADLAVLRPVRCGDRARVDRTAPRAALGTGTSTIVVRPSASDCSSWRITSPP